mmetsp:Transcript_73509/g.201877  ORF Transcript_73509/g.201877 Transcript_73509/m.201877 type:complete len:388 (+) Transcript_73509:366-1529(+)
MPNQRLPSGGSCVSSFLSKIAAGRVGVRRCARDEAHAGCRRDDAEVRLLSWQSGGITMSRGERLVEQCRYTSPRKHIATQRPPCGHLSVSVHSPLWEATTAHPYCALSPLPTTILSHPPCCVSMVGPHGAKATRQRLMASASSSKTPRTSPVPKLRAAAVGAVAVATPEVTARFVLDGPRISVQLRVGGRWSVPLFLLHLSHPPHPPHPPRRADGRRRRCCGHRPRRLRLRRRDAVSAAATPSPQSFTNYHHPPRRRPRHLPPPAAIRTANRATDRAAERASDRAADGAANRAAAAVRRPAAPRASPPSTPPPPPSTHRAADHTTRRHPPHRPPADGTVDPAAGRAAAAMQRAAVIPLLPLLPQLSPPPLLNPPHSPPPAPRAHPRR